MKRLYLSILISPAILLLMPFINRIVPEDAVPQTEIVPSLDEFNTLEGTWQLIAAKLAHTDPGMPDEYSNESGIVSMKIFTRNRFVFIRYDRETGELLGTGGGTYIQLGDEYTEYIDYHSYDSTLADFPQNFTCTFEGNLFTQRGTISGGDSNGQSLEEVYQRVEDPFSQIKGDFPLLGSWKLIKWAPGEVKEAEPLPADLHGFKIFTPTFYYAMRYRVSGGISSFSFGTYRATPDYLTEKVISVGDLSAVGRSYVFSWNRTDKGFKQYGFIDSDQFMGYKIEEYYQRE